ncbi:hypothetical protein ABPG75_002597 [Micractinium tetrahymenae]
MRALLGWLLAVKPRRPEYIALGDIEAEEGLGVEALSVSRLLVLIVLARLGFNAALGRTAQRLAQARGLDEHHRDGRRLLEECWVLLGNAVMLAASQHVVLRRNAGCTYLSTRTCLAGWPAHTTDPAVLGYYRLELAWYLHMLLKPVFHYGLKDGRDMIVHHCASLALIVVSYAFGLTRIGVLVLGTFAISNPLLHLAKICNQLAIPVLRLGGFLLFAAAFFASRVLLVPWAVLKPAALDSRHDVPHIKEDFPGLWWGVNALLALLYCLQLVWMAGIVRVVRQAVTRGMDAASRLSAKLDPSKRYAEPAEHAEHAAAAEKPAPACKQAAQPCQPGMRTPPPTPSRAAASPPAGAAWQAAQLDAETAKTK